MRSFEIACITRAFVVARDEKEARDMANAMLRVSWRRKRSPS